jgi:hypothetical protein
LDVKTDVELDSLHVKKIGIGDLVGYAYIVRVYLKKCSLFSFIYIKRGRLKYLLRLFTMILLHNTSVVSARKVSLVSARQADTIYTI